MSLPIFCRFLAAVALCALAGCHGAGVAGSGPRAGASGGANGDAGSSHDSQIIPLYVGDAGGPRMLGPGQKAAYACSQRFFPQTYACTGDSGKWAEALQKALWFFHANELGGVQTCSYIQWRGPAHQYDATIPLVHVDAGGNGVDMSDAFISANRAVLDPNGSGTIDVGGGSTTPAILSSSVSPAPSPPRPWPGAGWNFPRPTGAPGWKASWASCSRHSATTFYAAPTAIPADA
jgi:hypothetical protein